MTSTVERAAPRRWMRSWLRSFPAPRSPARPRCAPCRSSPAWRAGRAGSTPGPSATLRPGRRAQLQRGHPHGAGGPAGGPGQLRRGQRHRLGLGRQRRVRRVPAQGAGVGSAVPDFELLETMRWTRREGGVARWSGIWRGWPGRPSTSASPWTGRRARAGWLVSIRPLLTPDPARLRLLAGRRGELRLEVYALEAAAPAPVRLGLAGRRWTRMTSFSTTRPRTAQSMSRRGPAGRSVTTCCCGTERGELTETTTANLVHGLDGRLVTPPVESGCWQACYAPSCWRLAW
jgi:hypothetical protein